MELTTSISDALAYWTAPLCTGDLWARVRLEEMGEENGVVLREDPTVPGGTRYVLIHHENDRNLQWLSCSGTNVDCDTIDESPEDSFELEDGQFLAALVTGTGTDTVIHAWADPVGPDPAAWGPPDWTSSADPGIGQAADSGTAVGLYIGRGQGSNAGSFDDFSGGSLAAGP